jgi:MFS family permease
MNRPTAPDDAEEASFRYAGWRVVFVCFVMALVCWGFGFYGHAFYLAELQRQHGWPTSWISTAASLYYFVAAILVAFISDAIRRFGPRNCVLAGTFSFAIAVAALPFIRSPLQLYIVYLVMTVGWGTMSVAAVTNIIGPWFSSRRGLAISIALNGASLSGVIVVPALVLLAGKTSFTIAMLTGATLILAVMVPLAMRVLAYSPVFANDRLPSTGNTAASGPKWTRATALRSRAFWSVSGPFSLSLMSQAAFLVHIIAFLEPSMGRNAAGIAVAVTTAMAIVGRLVLGAFAHRIDQRMASALSLVSQSAALVLMIQTEDANLLFLACAVYGFSVGNLITFPALIIQREFDPASFGTIVAFSTAITQFTYSFGPGLIGIVRDAAGTYTAAILVCITLNLAAAAIVARRPQDV